MFKKENIKFIFIFFSSLILSCFFLVNNASAKYYDEGVLLSTNILSGEADMAWLSTFIATTSIPAGTTVSVQFSQNNTTFYNASNTAWGWTTLKDGLNEIDLKGLVWSGNYLYYKLKFTTDDEDATAEVSEVRVDDAYSIFPPVVDILSDEAEIVDVSAFSITASIPSQSTASIQFSFDNVNYYNATGTSDSWTSLADGANNISLSGISWVTNTLYYRLYYTTALATAIPTVSNASVDYDGTKYYAEGVLLSTNILSGTNSQIIKSFTCTSDIPASTTVSVQFSQDNTTFYDANNTAWGWTELDDGTDIVDIFRLGWTGANFYYKLKLTTEDEDATPTVSEVRVDFSDDINTAKMPGAYWMLDEGTGAIAHDEGVSGAHNGTITGAVWQDKDMCISGKCLYFDGDGDYVEADGGP